MVGTAGANTLLVGYTALVAILGIIAGGVTCFVLRKQWGVRWGAADAGLAVVGAFVAALIVTRSGEAHSTWESPIWVVLTIGVATVVVVHVLQRRVARQSDRDGGDAYRGAA